MGEIFTSCILPQAIGVTGALALAVHLLNNGSGKQYASVDECLADIQKTMDYLVTRQACAPAYAPCRPVISMSGMQRSQCMAMGREALLHST